MNHGLMKLSVLLLAAAGLASCNARAETPKSPRAETVTQTPVAPAATETSPPSEPGAKPYKDQPGPHEVAVLIQDWVDQTRQRTVPVKIYYPRVAQGEAPVVIFSHGLGGTREGYEYLGRHWASHGYVSVHLQHAGSDNSVWKDVRRAGRLQAMRDAAGNPLAAMDRPRDVTFAIDRLEAMNRDTAADAPLRGRLDLGKIAIAGHSFGAWTTLAAVGESMPLAGRRVLSMADKRIKAAIPMSAPVPRKGAELDAVFAPITVPCLHMTGTLDVSPINDTTAAERRLPFDHSANCRRYLITFTGGDHMIFSGRPRTMGGGEKDAEFQSLIRQSSLAFLDAYLQGEAVAKAWLDGGAFRKVLGDRGVLEQRTAGQTKPAKTPVAPPKESPAQAAS